MIAPHPRVDGWPVWSPDGKRLVFASERAGSSDLYVVDVGGGEPRRLTLEDALDERQPAWSPDGRFLAYAQYRWFRNQPFDEAAEIYVLKVEDP